MCVEVPGESCWTAELDNANSFNLMANRSSPVAKRSFQELTGVEDNSLTIPFSMHNCVSYYVHLN